MKRYLWVIEMKIDDRWLPTVWCNFTRAGARQSKIEWMQKNPDDKFRVCKYVPELKP